MNLNDLFAAANQQVIAPALSADELNAAASIPAPPDVSGLMTQQNPSLPVTPGLAPQKGSPLKNMLRNFMSGFGEGMTNAAGLETPEQKQSRQIADAYRQAQTNATNADIEFSKTPVPMIDPFSGQVVTDKNGNAMMMPLPAQQKLWAAQIGYRGKVDSATINQKGATDRAMTPMRQAQQEYSNAMDAGDTVKADFALKKMNALHMVAQISPTGKVDPIIYAQLGPMPDPNKDPDGALAWGQKAARIKTDMGPGPRVTTAMVNGVPTIVKTSNAQGMPAANMDPGAAARKAGAIAFGSGTEADQIQSFRAFVGHGDDLAKAATEFANTGSPLANKPLNWLRIHASGDPAVTNMLAKIDPVRKEFESFLLNNRALYQSDREEGMKIINENQSPAQMQSAIKSFMHTASIRLGALNQKYKDLYGTDHPTMMDPTTAGLLSEYGTTPQTSAPVTPKQKIINAARGGNRGGNNSPKIGDKKTFPNGKTGTWDGQGWVAE